MWDISPLEWFDDQTVFTMIDEGYVNLIGILHPNTVGTTCMYNGTDGYTFDESTTISFANFDAELSWLDINLNGKLVGSGTRNVAMAYSGETTLLGMVPGVEHEVEVGEVHIFDCGDIDYDNDWAYVYVEEFDPVRRYQVCFSSTDFAYYNPETEGAYNDVYTSDTLPTGPGAYVNEDGVYFSFWGTFFAAEGSEKPYGQWVGAEWWKQDDAGNVITTPEAYKLILGGYTLDISRQDGTWVVYGDYYRSPVQDSANMIIGDKNAGMDFTWTDGFGEKWHAAYKGDIFFHNDPTDFLKFEMIPAIEGITNAQSINLNKSQLDLSKGESVSLIATVLPENASNKSVTWTSSNTSVARVDKNGLVTAIGVGEAIITATTTDGTNLSASCKVTVYEEASANSLSGKTINTYSGASERVSVEMTNEQAITAFQCDIYLPDGISVATIDGEYDINLSSRAKSSHSLSCVEQSDGSIRLLCYSMSLATFSGNEGELFDINFNISKEIEGEYQVLIDNIVLTDKAQNEYKSSTTIDFNVKAYVPADVNNDGSINVTDVVATASYILGNDTKKFIFEAADMNKDGVINVTDIVGIASVILKGGTASNVSVQRCAPNSSDAIKIEDFAAGKNQSQQVAIEMTNASDYSAFQMDIRLPKGMSIAECELASAATDHMVAYRELPDGAVRVLVYSLTCQTLPNSEEGIIRLRTATDNRFEGGEIVVENILFADRGQNEYRLYDSVANVNLATGVSATDMDCVVYAENRSIVIISPCDQQATITSVDGVSRTYSLNEGRNEIDAPQAGVYIVTLADETFKVIVK